MASRRRLVGGHTAVDDRTVLLMVTDNGPPAIVDGQMVNHPPDGGYCDYGYFKGLLSPAWRRLERPVPTAGACESALTLTTPSTPAAVSAPWAGLK
ncbi:hypothetical protein AB0H00_30360 [Nocardia sp. NPDC023852]|uniref:hypothetical protein n=1 Tax=Nocardia sp. NPDC023852 TaxID=3154697 RepID=UPI0033FE9D02